MILSASWLLTFFFSSRGLHTRWPRDWSSDVCSSDLSSATASCCLPWRKSASAGSSTTPAFRERSEERRVGKECISRGGHDHLKKYSGKMRTGSQPYKASGNSKQ